MKKRDGTYQAGLHVCQRDYKRNGSFQHSLGIPAKQRKYLHLIYICVRDHSGSRFMVSIRKKTKYREEGYDTGRNRHSLCVCKQAALQPNRHHLKQTKKPFPPPNVGKIVSQSKSISTFIPRSAYIQSNISRKTSYLFVQSVSCRPSFAVESSHKTPRHQANLLGTSHNMTSPSRRSITVEDVDTRWPYRAGYPRLCRQSVESHCLDHEKMPISLENLESLTLRIREIIHKHGFDYDDGIVQIAYRSYTRGISADPPRHPLRVVGNIRYDKDTSHSELWAKAVTEIYDEVQSAVYPETEIGVELYDGVYMKTCEICEPPSHSKELLKDWEKGQNYCQQILQLFDGYGHMWQAMVPTGLRAIGEGASDHSTVIFFDALNADDDAWDAIEERMKAILPPEISIEIRQASSPLFLQDDPTLSSSLLAHFTSLFQELERPPRPACAISVKNSLVSGTMGGYVVTVSKDTGIKTAFGVTNAHVALNSHEEVTLKRGCCRDANPIKIQSPPEKHRRESESQLRYGFTQAQSDISMWNEVIEAANETDPYLTDKLQKLLSVAERENAARNHALQRLQKDVCVGATQAATLGWRNYQIDSTEHELLMDIGLISVDSLAATHPKEVHVKTSNCILLTKEGLPCISEYDSFDTWEVEGLGRHPHTEPHIKVVAKLGQKSDLTIGIINDFRAIINIPLYNNGVRSLRSLSAWSISTPYKWTLPVGGSKDVPTLAKPGDSGSFVIAAADWNFEGNDNEVPMLANSILHQDRKPFVVGLLWGTSESGKLAYFIPFDAVKEEIESLTGEEMVWPKKRSEAIPIWEKCHDFD
ncbi:hypothetical protein BGW36DRAFT_360361 [Talaromyces proteolyticus]|uniref:Uncharacterized protein n=1 Tax=Talaromyces proteolyticus TaxID=1131652 RepID=A0AAD4KPM3_9EURO|nr:uncharacterized protein BGW36DRAFT_360361 [Talaromyces proteolyticus]KAH8696534.1 hypothetical protein BGW36DRAFT_360361 [Talaromyces proteolyticus]